jgi:hypothetical protein
MKVSLTDGSLGFFEVADTNAFAGKNIAAIQIVTAAVFSNLQGNGLIKGANPSTGVVTAGATYPAGDILYGYFHAGQLASGHIRCYHKVPNRA